MVRKRNKRLGTRTGKNKMSYSTVYNISPRIYQNLDPSFSYAYVEKNIENQRHANY